MLVSIAQLRQKEKNSCVLHCIHVHTNTNSCIATPRSQMLFKMNFQGSPNAAIQIQPASEQWRLEVSRNLNRGKCCSPSRNLCNLSPQPWGLGMLSLAKTKRFSPTHDQNPLDPPPHTGNRRGQPPWKEFGLELGRMSWSVQMTIYP